MIKGMAKDMEKYEIRPMIEFVKSLGGKDLIGAEIGVFQGFNALNILYYLPIKKLYLIDPYLLYKEYLDINSPFAYFSKKAAKKRLAPYEDKIIHITKKSEDAANDVPDNLDFIYIDGNHSYEYVIRDIATYWYKVKKGGVIGGHDYYNKGKAREVKKAVDEYVEKNKLKLHVDGIDWWVVK